MKKKHTQHSAGTGEGQPSIRIQELTDIVDRKLDADRRFFMRWPWRRFRVRRAYRAELELIQAADPEHYHGPAAGKAWFVAVEQLRPGARLRLFFCAPADTDTDMSEQAARAMVQMSGEAMRIRASLVQP